MFFVVSFGLIVLYLYLVCRLTIREIRKDRLNYSIFRHYVGLIKLFVALELIKFLLVFLNFSLFPQHKDILMGKWGLAGWASVAAVLVFMLKQKSARDYHF